MNIPLLVFNDVTGQYIAGIETQRGNVSVARHINDMGELIGIAQTGIARAALIVSGTEQLTATNITNLVNNGVAVIVLRDPGDETQLSVEDTISSLSTIEEILECIENSVLTLAYKQSPTSENLLAPTTAEPQQLEPKENSVVKGKIVTFWGSGGAPGRSTLAVHIAGYLSKQGLNICLIDADTYAPSISGILGISEDYSAISQLAHFAEKGSLTEENFLKTVSSIKHSKSTMDVVTGISNAERWVEIRQTAFEKVLEVARTIYDIVLVDINQIIEFDEELKFDAVLPLRNGCALTALEQADHIFAIGAADAVGIPRLIKALEQLAEIEIDLKKNVSIHPWINKVRDSSIGSKPEQQLDAVWQRFGGKYRIEGFIPWEPELFDKALLTGQTVVELPKNHKIIEAITNLADPLVTERHSLVEQQNPEQTYGFYPSVIVQREPKKRKLSIFRRR